MPRQLSPKNAALAIGVSESSLKRWCDQGLIDAQRTPGGHRRVSLESLVTFLRSSGRTIEDPAALGLPSDVDQWTGVTDSTLSEFVAGVLAGDEEKCRAIAMGLFLSGTSIVDICDKVIAPAMHRVGDLWECGEAAIYQERRSCAMCERVLTELRLISLSPSADAPKASGGTLSGDPYTLPTTMVELTLRERGWNATSLGASLPAETLCAAIADLKPKLFWLSASHIADRGAFLSAWRQVEATAQAQSAMLVVGGLALDAVLRRQMRYTAFCDTLAHLDSVLAAQGMNPTPRGWPAGAPRLRVI